MMAHRWPLTGFSPTPRALRVLLLLALVSVFIAAAAPGAWTVAPAAGGALMVVVMIDAVLAGGLIAFQVTAPDDGEVGAALPIVIDAQLARHAGWTRPAVALAAETRLINGGRIDATMTAVAQGGHWQATSTPALARRGTAQITRGWLRWQGPLGLAHRHATRPIDRTVRVWPNLAPARGRGLQIFLRETGFGRVARRIRGDGSEFEAMTEYQPGMDWRRIDWKSSARHGALQAREYDIERNNQIVFALDCGQAMCEPIGGLARIDRAVTAALTTAWVALKADDRVALFGFAAKPLVMSPFIAGASHFNQLQRAAAALDYHDEDGNFTLAMATLSTRLQRRSLIVVFADFTDPTAAELMIEMCARLVQRHRILFVVMRDDDLDRLATAAITGTGDLARAVVAQALIRQRALVLTRLRQIGIRVIEARWEAIGTRLLEAYLAIKREGSIG